MYIYPLEVPQTHLHPHSHTMITGWLVGRLTSPFSTKIGYIGGKVLHGGLVPPG